MTAPEDRKGRGYVTQAKHQREKRWHERTRKERDRAREHLKLANETNATLSRELEGWRIERAELRHSLAMVTRERDEAREDAKFWKELEDIESDATVLLAERLAELEARNDS